MKEGFTKLENGQLEIKDKLCETKQILSKIENHITNIDSKLEGIDNKVDRINNKLYLSLGIQKSNTEQLNRLELKILSMKKVWIIFLTADIQGFYRVKNSTLSWTLFSDSNPSLYTRLWTVVNLINIISIKYLDEVKKD